VIRFWIELSKEHLRLARVELEGALQALRAPEIPDDQAPVPEGFIEVALSGNDLARRLTDRLALARGILRPWPITDREGLVLHLGELGGQGIRARFRGPAPSGPGPDPHWLVLIEPFRKAGGHVDLERGTLALRFFAKANGGWRVAEEIHETDRRGFRRRGAAYLPFRRPVSLPPLLARVLVNMACVRAGDQVMDPFLGTGGLLAEAGLVGARISGVDHDARMVRGALENLSFLGLTPEKVVVGDAADMAPSFEDRIWDAVVTDPPYGRASSSGSERPEELVTRVLGAWSHRVRPGGRIALAVPEATGRLLPSWRLVASVPYRRHRSLTRDFRVYERPLD
jgi:predicted RNA methylase